jgi:hypothetical protein
VGANADALTGLRIVELLHASLLELQIMSDETVRAAPPLVRSLAAPPAVTPVSAPSRVAVGVGVLAAMTPGRVAWALGPLLRTRVTLTSHVGLEAEGAVSLAQRRLERDGAAATIDLSLARARLRFEPWPERRLSLAISPDIGFLLVRASGITGPGLVTHDTSTLVALPGATLSASWRLAPTMALTLGWGVSAVTDRVRVRFGDTQVARLGAIWSDVTLALMVAL